MTQIKLDISMSLDGFVAGPDQTLEQPLGEGGMLLHEWVLGLASWRERHGLEGGERNQDDELLERAVSSVGAFVMGRRMFSGGEGPWEADPNAGGWWGDDPPFRAPVFVVTHHPRESVTFANGTSFVFVTDGVEAAVEQARTAAAGKDVGVSGGAAVAQQCLRAGLLDELRIHLAPVLLGDGVRLFDGAEQQQLELVETVPSPAVTHLTYRSANEQRDGE